MARSSKTGNRQVVNGGVQRAGDRSVIASSNPRGNMPKKRNPNSEQSSVRVGNLSNVSGEVHIAGRDIVNNNTNISTGLSAVEIGQLFEHLYQTIETRPSTPVADKEDLKSELSEIQTTVIEAAEKNGKVDEGFLSRHFRNIARMAPDLLDVIVATLANPLAGLGIAFTKIADQARKETSAGS